MGVSRFQEILLVLTQNKGEWIGNPDLPCKIRKGDVLKIDRPHHYFIISRLHPTTNASEISRARAEYLYAMRTGLAFNIGHVIEQSILAMVKSKGKKLYGLASLITGLCHMAGVQDLPGDFPAPVGRLLDKVHVDRLDGEEVLEAEDGDETEDQGETDAEPERPMVPPPRVPPPRSRARARAPPATGWEERMTSLEAQMAALQASTTSFHDRLAAIETQQSAFRAESSDFYAEMRRYFSGAGPSGGGSSSPQ